MPESQTKKKLPIKVAIALVGLGFLFFVGDIFYDTKSGDAAILKCGEGKVKSVSTKGFFQRDISCFPDES